ncbi:MAG: PAS domain S-box protein, partial [Methanocalculus sp.]|uniref:PAS domain S-box protein n=1 Tax=Methanocalculus sp. TaxID=2004547 RepID=UPI00271D84E4
MAHPFPLSKKDYPSLCPLTGMEPGNHLCCLYRTEAEHQTVITQCIRCGLERNEKVLSIVDSSVKDLIPGYIREDGIDPEPYLQSGQLEIQTVQESSLKDGVFDPEAVIRQLAASTEAAVSEGYSALRVINEMTLVPGNLPERARLIEYETLLNTFLPGSRCLMVCLYDRRSVPSDILLNVFITHPYAVIGTELIENLSFIQPDEFITKDRWSVLLDHWIENLKERNSLIRTLTHEKEIVETYLDVAGVMMVALDTEGTVMMANQKTLDLLGIPESDLIGENWFDRAIPERLREEVRLVHSRLIIQDEAADLFFDNPVLTTEGEERIIAWYNTLLRDDTGLVIGTLSSGEDVTELRIAEAERKKEHEALLESEHRLSDIIDFLPDATFAIDENGVVIAWNHAIEEMTGVSAEEMIGQGEYAYALPFYGKRQPILIDLAFKDDPALRSRYDLLKEMPDVIEAETRYARPRGDERTLWGRVSPLHDRQGRNVGAIETIRDITEQKQSEALVKESEIRYRRLFEAAKDGILILDEDDGTIIDANPFILEMLGYRLEELLGRTVSEIGFIHDKRFAEEAFLRLKEEGYIRYEDLPLETKDGRLMEVEFISNRYAINDHSVIQCNIRDITERKHAEAALRLSESLKHHILAAVPDILIRSDAEGRYLDILTPDDDRFILPKADLIGRTITDVTSEEIGSRLTEAIRLALSSEEMQTVEYTLTVPAGNLHFEARIVPYLKDEVIALIRDITDRKEAEDALHERIKELSCLYRISAAVEHFHLSESEVLQNVLLIIPEGFQYPEATRVRITIDDTTYSTPGFSLTNCSLVRDILIHQQVAGAITICFDDEYKPLTEESVLIRIIAEQIGRYIERIRSDSLLQMRNAELAEERARLLNIIEGTQAGTWEWNIQTGETVFNEEWARMLGYTLDELSPISIATWQALSDPDDLKSAGDLLQKHFAHDLPYYDCEMRMRHKDGHWIWIQDRGRVISRTDDGRPLMMFGIHLDITDRKIAEEELRRKNEELATAEEELRSQLEDLVATQQQLRESEAYIRTVLDNLPIGIAVNSVDPEVNFEYFNENFFRIYRTTAEALQRADAFWDVVYEDPDFRSELRGRVLADGISGDPSRMQWEDIPITRKGEKTTYISARNMPVPGKDLVISTVWDVTGRVEAEREIKHRLAFERVISDISSGFVTESDFDVAINKALGEIGIFCGASRSYVFLIDPSGDEISNTHEWCADGVPPTIELLQKKPTNLYPWWMERLRNSESIMIQSLNDLPGEAVGEREILEQGGVTSLIVLPLLIRSRLAGFIGLDNVGEMRDWTEEDLHLLKITSELFGTAFEQKYAEDRILLNFRRIEALLELHGMTDAIEQELFTYALDAATRMTESRYAFIGLMNDDESVMTVHAWSDDVMNGCTVQNTPILYPIASAGIWGECVRNRKPAVFNEYAASHPAKHGYPEGHVPITRYLGVPIFDGSRIVAVLAVANKESEYRDDDIDALMTLGNAMW